MTVTRISSLLHRDLVSKNGENYSSSADLSSVFALRPENHTTIRHEILAPGRSASGLHSHSGTTESVLVLEGEATAYIGAEKYTLKTGEMIRFDPSNLPHVLKNESDCEVRYLTVAILDSKDEIRYF